MVFPDKDDLMRVTIDSVLVSPDKDDLMLVTIDKVYWCQYKTESFLSVT